MNDMTDKERCSRGCMFLGAGVGAALFLMFWLIAGWNWLLALAIGAVLGGIAMFLFSFIFCGKIKPASAEDMKPRPVGSDRNDTVAGVSAGSSAGKAADVAGAADQSSSTDGVKAAEPAADVSAAAADPSGKAEQVASGGAAASTTETQDPVATAAVGGAASEPTAANAPAEGQGNAVIKPSKPLKGQEELAKRKGSYKYEAPQADTAKVKKAAPKKAAADAGGSAAAKQASADKSAATPAAVADIPADTPESQPDTLSAARPEGPDDLKLISGVGPKLEQTLNDLGFYHFDQIAKWGPQEIAWVDARLRFKGRIARDNWMAQAKTLAEGGETEFSGRKKKT